jgi:hypothetical protein
MDSWETKASRDVRKSKVNFAVGIADSPIVDSLEKLNLAAPKVMLASNLVVVISFKTISCG